MWPLNLVNKALQHYGPRAVLIGRHLIFIYKPAH
jgi:hypothetical protein